jgi:hypothetical protein
LAGLTSGAARLGGFFREGGIKTSGRALVAFYKMDVRRLSKHLISGNFVANSMQRAARSTRLLAGLG